jgi:hypothetical protein
MPSDGDRKLGARVPCPCVRPSLCSRLHTQQLAHVGWLLFQSHLRNICRVVATASRAKAQLNETSDCAITRVYIPASVEFVFSNSFHCNVPATLY